MTSFRGILSKFRKHEDGTASWFSLIPLVFVLIVLGLGLDVNSAIQSRTELQVTADAAAHAAIVTRNSSETATEGEADLQALILAELNMPAADNGTVLRIPNIEFGIWDDATRTFTPSAGSRWAVRVTTEQREANNNPVATYLLRLAGFNSWDIRARATMVAYYKTCHNNGFIGEGIVDLQSNNEFKDYFCIHSNTHVEANQGNYFEDGTVVSMPNTDDLVIPASGFAHNEGLQEALEPDGYGIKEVADLPDLIEGLDKSLPDYTEGESPKFLESISGYNEVGTVRDLNESDLEPGKVNHVGCSGSGQVNVKKDTEFNNIVVITECKLFFESGVRLQDAIVATTNTSARSISGPSGIQIGNHSCGTPGGSAAILTMGGAQFGAGLTFKSGQIIARGDVQFPARDVGVEGASVLAGGRIDGTSNMTMAFCGDGDDFFKVKYYRIVE
jgi:Flp pilus assembly protein TadG